MLFEQRTAFLDGLLVERDELVMTLGERLLQALDDILHGELVRHSLEQSTHDHHVVGFGIADLESGVHSVDGIDGDVVALGMVVDTVGVVDEDTAGLHLGAELIEALLVEGDDDVICVEHGGRDTLVAEDYSDVGCAAATSLSSIRPE